MKRALLFIFAGSVVVAAGQPADARESDVTLEQSPSFFANQHISGSAGLDYSSSSKQLDDARDFWGGTAQIKWLPSLTDKLDAKIESRLSSTELRNGKTSSKLLEAYLTWRFDQTDIRVGKQIVAWGRADGLNPTDNLTPRDYATLLPFEEDQRFGTFALKLNRYLTNGQTLSIFATPYFEPSKFPQAPTNNVALTEKRPARTLANTELGVKLDESGSGLDWSVSYFHGYSLTPEIRIAEPLQITPALELHYPAIDVLGADMARNFGRYGMRAEFAYIRPRNTSLVNGTGMKPYLFYVLGVDRTFWDNLNINLQLIGRRIQNHTQQDSSFDPVSRDIGLQNALTFGQEKRDSYGISSRISDKWFNDTLEAEVLVFANFSQGDGYMRPLLSYALSDQMKATLGAELYRGPKDSYFGPLRNNRRVFAELRYIF